jgi:hypothetical protein
MTLTVRLEPQLQQQLDVYCRKRRLSKTQVVTALLTEHLARASGSDKTPYALAREFGLVGAYASGKGDLAENRKRYLRERLRAKHSR